MPHTWTDALEKYRYAVDPRRFADAKHYTGWFELNICPGDPLQTMGFETRFREQARYHPEAWAEVVFWKLYSTGSGRAARTTGNLLGVCAVERFSARSATTCCGCHLT